MTRSGRGGVNALAGFEFQLSRALLAVIQATERGSGETFIEALSDLVEADRGIVIGQAKRTLSSSALQKAMDEFWAIRELAKKVAPKLVDKLNFQIQVSRSVLQDWRGSADRWSPSEAHDVDEVDAFRSGVEMVCTPWPRLEAARILLSRYRDPTPLATFDQCLGELLAAASSSEFDVVITRFRIKLAALESRLTEAAEQIGLWGADDCPPHEVHREDNLAAAVRVGQRLSLADLRGGRLAHRKIYGDVHTACEAWIAGAGPSRDKLGVFWIEGRSGSGKSAALLHLLHSLHSADASQRVVLWLGGRSHLVAEGVVWAKDLISQGFQVIIGIDDPYTAARQLTFLQAVRIAQGEWERIRDSGARIGSEPRWAPMIVCCGPIEQRYAAESATFDELDIYAYRLRAETAEDLDELARWYELRTGQLAPVVDGDTLLVQRFFEWTNGNLREFALRFRMRLEDMDAGSAEKEVLEVFARILALGRLYVDYPADVLASEIEASPKLAAAFYQLESDDAHLSLTVQRDGTSGVRLTHPHLADAIYREWFGRDPERPYRLRHLRQALSAALQRPSPEPSIRLAPLWAIARLLDNRFLRDEDLRADLRRRIDLITSELRDVLPALYQEFASGTAELSDLPVWVDLNSRLDLDLRPRPLERIASKVRATTAPEKGLRLSCHMLLDHRDDDDVDGDAPRIVGDLLVRLAEWNEGGARWYDWGPLAAHYIRVKGVSDLRAPLLRLSERGSELPAVVVTISEMARREGPVDPIVLQWLQNAPTHIFEWPIVLMEVRSRGPFDAFTGWALRFLSERPDHFMWSTVWLQLRKEAPDNIDLVVRGLAWLGAIDHEQYRPALSDTSGFDRVWQDLWQTSASDPRQIKQLANRGINWLDEVDRRNSGWSYVWEQLYRVYAGDPVRGSLLEIGGLDWLVDVPQHPGWAFVWRPLAANSTGSGREELSQIARDWLTRIGGFHLGWLFVWEAEFDHVSDDTAQWELTELLLGWMSEINADDARWIIGRRKLEGGYASGEQISSATLHWLARGDPGIRGWAYFWSDECRRHKDARVLALRARLDEWLATADPWPDEWPVALRYKLNAARDHVDDRLLPRAIEWLESAQASHPHWVSVWIAAANLCRAASPALVHKVQVLCLDWLAVEFANSGWSTAWTRLVNWSVGTVRSNAYDQAKLWLAIDSSRRRWESVWLTCAYQRPDLFADNASDPQLKRWLLENGPGHPAWVALWTRRLRLDDKFPDDANLTARASEWLGSARPERKEWTLVWRGIAKSSHADANFVIDQALNWLPGRPPDRIWWGVWGRLFTTARSRPATRVLVCALALPYLASSEDGRYRWFMSWSHLAPRNPAVFASPEVIALSDEWLSASADDENWRRIWTHRVHTAPSITLPDATLRSAFAWLNGLGRSDNRWSYIWSDVGKFARGRDDATSEWIAVAANWLSVTPFERSGWGYVWLRLWRAAPPLRRTHLFELGRRWLAAGVGDQNSRHRACGILSSYQKGPPRCRHK